MPKKKSTVDPKLQARLDAKVRPDEPVKEDRIYYNMKPKKKAPAKKTTKKSKKLSTIVISYLKPWLVTIKCIVTTNYSLFTRVYVWVKKRLGRDTTQ